MEYYPTVLKDEIEANEKKQIYFSHDETLGFSLQIIRGLAYIHSLNIIHRDLKVLLGLICDNSINDYSW